MYSCLIGPARILDIKAADYYLLGLGLFPINLQCRLQGHWKHNIIEVFLKKIS